MLWLSDSVKPTNLLFNQCSGGHLIHFRLFIFFLFHFLRHLWSLIHSLLKSPAKIYPKCLFVQLAHGLSGWKTGFYKTYQIIKCQTTGIFRHWYSGIVGTFTLLWKLYWIGNKTVHIIMISIIIELGVTLKILHLLNSHFLFPIFLLFLISFHDLLPPLSHWIFFIIILDSTLISFLKLCILLSVFFILYYSGTLNLFKIFFISSILDPPPPAPPTGSYPSSEETKWKANRISSPVPWPYLAFFLLKYHKCRRKMSYVGWASQYGMVAPQQWTCDDVKEEPTLDRRRSWRQITSYSQRCCWQPGKSNVMCNTCLSLHRWWELNSGV